LILISIAGGSGSGKTTFAKKVLEYTQKNEIGILNMDSYYLDNLPREIYTTKGTPNFDHPNAFDWELLRNHIETLKEGKSVDVPQYDFETNSRLENKQTIGPFKILIFEGIFSLFDEQIRSAANIKCYLHVEADIRFTRRLHRDVKERGRSLESVISQYYDTVRPMYQKYLDPQKQHADFTVGEETDVAAKILAARINELLK
jgi:uridine kinase